MAKNSLLALKPLSIENSETGENAEAYGVVRESRKCELEVTKDPMPKYPENFWYPVLDALSVKGTPRRPLCLRRFGQNFAAWKTATGQWVVMGDRCPHKGAPLSQGTVVGDNIRCAYHGLEFDGSGTCTRAPVLGTHCPIPSYLKTTKYPIREAFGFLWLWWGKQPPTEEIPFYPELRNERIKFKADSFLYPASFYRVMESNFDAYHIDHLHGNAWSKMGSIVHSSECVVEDRLIKVRNEYRKTPEGRSLVGMNHILFPNLAMAVCPEQGFKNIIACCPVDENTTWFMVRFYLKAFDIPIAGRLIAKFLSLYSRHILAPQDFRIASRQMPRDTGMGTDKLILPADRGILEYWKILRAEVAFHSEPPLIKAPQKREVVLQ